MSGIMSDFFSNEGNIFRSESHSRRSDDSCPSTGNFSRRAGPNVKNQGEARVGAKEGVADTLNLYK